MFCRRMLMSSGRATVAQQVEYGLFLLEAGRLKAAEAVVSTRPNPEAPRDLWRTVFLEHMVRAEGFDGLRAATRECLERHPGVPAFMRVEPVTTSGPVNIVKGISAIEPISESGVQAIEIVAAGMERAYFSPPMTYGVRPEAAMPTNTSALLK